MTGKPKLGKHIWVVKEDFFNYINPQKVASKVDRQVRKRVKNSISNILPRNSSLLVYDKYCREFEPISKCIARIITFDIKRKIQGVEPIKLVNGNVLNNEPIVRYSIDDDSELAVSWFKLDYNYAFAIINMFLKVNLEIEKDMVAVFYYVVTIRMRIKFETEEYKEPSGSTFARRVTEIDKIELKIEPFPVKEYFFDQ